MTTHNPVEGIPIQPQVSTSEQSMGRFRKFFRSTGGRITVGAVGVTAAAGAVAYALAPKGGEAAPAPVTTNSAEPFPTEEPTSEATPKPDTEVVVFNGTVNYEAILTDWETLTKDQRDTACAEFVSTNLPDLAPVGRESTGPEVVAWHGAIMELLAALALDKSDPRNYQVAINLVDCITSSREEGEDGKTSTLASLDIIHRYGLESFKPEDVPRITEVSRYSDGVFPAQGTIGGAYEAMRIEGHYNALGEPFVHEIYALNDSSIFPGFTLVTHRSADPAPAIPTQEFKPPIVLDQSRANEPWQS